MATGNICWVCYRNKPLRQWVSRHVHSSILSHALAHKHRQRVKQILHHGAATTVRVHLGGHARNNFNTGKVGRGTFVDPRQEGGKINRQTTEDIVSVIELGGQELLFYKTAC